MSTPTREITEEEQKKYDIELTNIKFDLLDAPNTAFISAIAFSLDHHFDYGVPTAATNGSFVKYNPDFWKTLNKKERLFLFLHETWHVVLKHCILLADNRMGDREIRKANEAQDHVINNFLIEAGFHMPVGGMADPQYADMSFEEVYELLPDAPDPKPKWGGDDVRAAEGDPEELNEQLNDIILQGAIQAEEAGDNPGSIPGDLQVLIESLRKPKIPFKQLLIRHMKAVGKSSISWKRPNKRYLRHAYLPTVHSPTVGSVNEYFDMSCSVSDQEIEQYVGDTYRMICQVQPKTMKLIQFDTEIFDEEIITSAQQLMNKKFHGRGGTSIFPVIEHIKKDRPSVALIFTDGEFYTRGLEDPGVPIIWLIHNDPNWQPPFGQVYNYEV